jgi:hypothetical protein
LQASCGASARGCPRVGRWGSGPSFAAIVSEPAWLTADKAIERKSSRRPEYRWLYPFVMSQFLDEGLSARFFEITRRANAAEIRKTQEIAGRETE